MGVCLLGVCLLGVCLCVSGRVSPGRVSPGRVSPGRVSPGRVSPGRVSPWACVSWRVSHRRGPHGPTSHGRAPRGPVSHMHASHQWSALGRQARARPKSLPRPAHRTQARGSLVRTTVSHGCASHEDTILHGRTPHSHVTGSKSYSMLMGVPHSRVHREWV